MKRLHTQVSRADILRLLAVSRNASAAVAAKMTGYPVEQEGNQIQKKKKGKGKGKGKEEEQEITRSCIRVHAQDEQDKAAPLEPVTQKLPHEAFWYLSEKRALKKTLHRLAVLHACQEIESPNEKKRILPVALLKIHPLSKEELAVPTFVPWESNESPPSPFSNKRPIPIAQPNQDRFQDRFLDNLVASTAESLSVPCNKRRQIRRKKTEQTVRRKKQAAKKNALRIRRLLGLLSVAAYIDPFLLQETVRLIPSSPSSASVRTDADTDIASGIATENALRSHPDVEQDSKLLLALKSEKKEIYYQIFAQEDEQMQTDMLALLRQRDAAHSPLLFALELLPVLPFVESPLLQKQLIGWLESFILRLVRTWFDQFDHQTLVQHAEQLLQLIKMLPQKCKRQITAHSFLYGIVHNNSLRSGAVLSPEYDPERVIQTVQKAMWPVNYQVIQQGEKLFLYPSSEALSPHLPGSPLVEFELSVDCLLVHNKGEIATLPVQSGVLVHDCTDQGKEVYVQTPTEQLVFNACFRPSWAKTIGRHKKGLFVDTSWLGITHRLIWTNSTEEGAGQWNGCGPLQTDQYGLFIDLKITERITQRFRQITPGWFMMGSPKDEPERESWGKESLHEVILTKEFWVADTVVTQELWQAVIGDVDDFGSFFSGAHRPVEQVSYQAAIFFLQHLNKRIPGIRARLLTEAEWEYCCRAGSATPFCFGNHITPDQVNYNGQYPYHTGLVGKNRRQSVPVKSFPCNDWGLFEMHGNVWEWCQDYWQEDLFSQEPQVDPTGPENGEFRVVRGGSWFLGGRGVRSAVRGKFASHFSNSRIGFRIALFPQEMPTGSKK